MQVHLCFTSPKVRARDTAVLACEALGVEPIDHAALFAGFDVADALELLAAAGPDQRVLVIGHEPDFSQVVDDLAGGRVDFKKGGIAGVRVDSTRGELIACCARASSSGSARARRSYRTLVAARAATRSGS